MNCELFAAKRHLFCCELSDRLLRIVSSFVENHHFCCCACSTKFARMCELAKDYACCVKHIANTAPIVGQISAGLYLDVHVSTIEGVEVRDVYIYIYIHNTMQLLCLSLSVYIYIERDMWTNLSLYIYIYIYM